MLVFLCLSECVAHCFEKVDLTSSVIGFKTRDLNCRFPPGYEIVLGHCVCMVCFYHFKSNNKYIEYLDDLFETKRVNNNQIIKLISQINQILEHPEAE